MGKKVKRSTYVSKGIHSNVNSGLLKSMRRDANPFEKAMNKLKAWKAGKNPWITIPNGERGTNRPFIRVRANAYYGDHRRTASNIFGKKDSE